LWRKVFYVAMQALLVATVDGDEKDRDRSVLGVTGLDGRVPAAGPEPGGDLRLRGDDRDAMVPPVSRSPATRPSSTPMPTPNAYAPTLSGSSTSVTTSAAISKGRSTLIVTEPPVGQDPAPLTGRMFWLMWKTLFGS
jgi:hypothetical protein